MKKTITWILVADGAQARVFVNEGPGKGIAPVSEAQFDPARLPDREIVTDRPGRVYDRVGGGRHAMTPTTDPQRDMKARFAHAVAERLDEAAGAGQFDRLVVIAPAKVLGDLRGDFSDRVRARILAELSKDLTGKRADELAPHLEEVMVP